MSIPFVRYVQGEDDGVSQYECLACYERWSVRSQVIGWEGELIWKFCPSCGILWKGEKKWDQKRKYELGHGLNREPWPDARLRPLQFEIQSRFTPLTNGVLDVEERTGWRTEARHLRDAVVAAKALKEKRAEGTDPDTDEFGIEEYRVVPSKKETL